MKQLEDIKPIISFILIIVFGIPSWLTWAEIKPSELNTNKIITIINKISAVKLNVFQILLLISILLFAYQIKKLFKSKTIIYKDRLHYDLLWTIRTLIQNNQVSVIASEPKCKEHRQEVISVRTAGPLSPYVFICPEEGCNTVKIFSDDMDTLKNGTEKKEKAIFLAKYKQHH